MAAMLTDPDIASMLATPKAVTRRELSKLKRPSKKKGKQLVARLNVMGGRRKYRVSAQRSANETKKNNFSIVLSCVWNGKWINLIRCNGHHGPHTNTLEQKSGTGVAFIRKNTFHVHRATERYHRYGVTAEWYAEPTDEYYSFEGAVEFMCGNFGFFISDVPNKSLYPLWGE